MDRIGVGEPLRAARHAARARARLRDSQILIRDYFSQSTTPKLHIGCSSRLLPGWLNTDVELHKGVAYLDCTKPFPFDSNTLSFVFCEHFIEHLEREQGAACLREVHRCLKPGGVFRLATPDLDRFVGLFAPTLDDEQRQYLQKFTGMFGLQDGNACETLNFVMHSWGHKFLYTRAQLASSLSAAGFSRIDSAEVSSSRHDALQGVERHQEFVGEAMNRFETMVLEATK